MTAAASFEPAAPATVGKHPCPECGGNLEWHPQAQTLRCPYCGTTAPWSPSAHADDPSAIAEQDLLQALRNPASGRGWGQERYEVECQNCRAISVFDAQRTAQRCDFCGSPAIVAHTGGGEAITPQSILPFKISDGQIRDRIRQWYGSRWFAPNKLKTAALTDTLHGIYLPYWTFDAHVAASWRAEAGHYYYVPVTVRGSNGTTSTRMERRVRWVPASGQLQHFFDDLAQCASSGVHANLLQQIEPYPFKQLRPYAAEYVRGWTVERYQLDLPSAARSVAARMEQQTRQLCAAQVPGDTHRGLQVQASYSGRTFKHVLVPVWLVTYRYGRKNYQVAVNGYTGVVAGERPYSAWKIIGAVLAVLLVLLLAGLLLR